MQPLSFTAALFCSMQPFRFMSAPSDQCTQMLKTRRHALQSKVSWLCYGLAGVLKALEYWSKVNPLIHFLESGLGPVFRLSKTIGDLSAECNGPYIKTQGKMITSRGKATWLVTESARGADRADRDWAQGQVPSGQVILLHLYTGHQFLI